MSLKQLSSPPESAKALASWFLGRQGPSPSAIGFFNPKAPLATVEMLLSPSQTYARPGGSNVLVDPATRGNIAQGFAHWKERAAANVDNTAVFYFCGHGVSGANDYLLPSDFGAINRENPWADAIDITETARAMRRLASGPLYFLIDACRQASRDALSPGARPPALAYVDFKKPVRGFIRLILWATGEGEAAFGAKADASRFCAAVVEALSGYEAEVMPDGNGWVVTGEMLARSVRRILEAKNASLEPDKRQFIEEQLISSQPFHFETLLPHRVAAGTSSSWSVGHEVRQQLANLGVVGALPEKALEVLTERLETKNLQVQALQKEVNDWMRRYQELKRDIDADDDSDLLQRARALLDAGKLQEAGTAYEELIRAAETRRDAENARIALHSLNRGRIFRLDFKSLQALPYYEKAYGLCPDNLDYALDYAELLLEQCDYRRAEIVLFAVVAQLRKLTASTNNSYQHQLARTLHCLGNVHAEEHHFLDARQAFEETLAIRRELAKTDPAAYLSAIAATLHDLGTLLVDERCYADTQQTFEEALAIRRDLARANPSASSHDEATTLNNLGNLHYFQHHFVEARQAFEEALAIQRVFAQTNAPAYQPDFARMLNNIGNLEFDEHHYAEARRAFEEALAIHRELTQSNPTAYRAEVARMLNNLGGLDCVEHRFVEGRRAFEEALVIRRELAKANPEAYRPDLATTLDSSGNLDCEERRYAEARQAFEEALAIRRDLARAKPEVYNPDFATTLNNFGSLQRDEHRYAEARRAFEEALAIRRELAKTNPTTYQSDLATPAGRRRREAACGCRARAARLTRHRRDIGPSHRRLMQL